MRGRTRCCCRWTTAAGCITRLRRRVCASKSTSSGTRWTRLALAGGRAVGGPGCIRSGPAQHGGRRARSSSDWTKTYTLQSGKPVFDIALRVENTGGAPLTVQLEQDAALGIREEYPTSDMRKVLATQWGANGAELSKSGAKSWAELQKAVLNGSSDGLELLRTGYGPLAWTALANKYFAAYTRPLAPNGARPDYVAAVRGLVVAPYVAPGPAQ